MGQLLKPKGIRFEPPSTNGSRGAMGLLRVTVYYDKKRYTKAFSVRDWGSLSSAMKAAINHRNYITQKLGMIITEYRREQDHSRGETGITGLYIERLRGKIIGYNVRWMSGGRKVCKYFGAKRYGNLEAAKSVALEMIKNKNISTERNL